MSQDELTAARGAALELLQRDAAESELREAAGRLGSALVGTADEGDLWKRLADAGPRIRTLTDEQRAALQGAVTVDWSGLLTEVGYQPPPPLEAYSTELVEAIRVALETRRPADVRAARDRVRALGTTLVELGEPQHVPPSRLRRWLRRGVRVAGTVLVVVGVAAAGVALVHALPASLKLSPFLAEVAVDVVKDGVVRVLDWTLDRALAPGEDESHADTAADREALTLIHESRDGERGRLAVDWEVAGEASAIGPVDKTREYVTREISALYRAWSIAIGAPWYTAEVASHFDQLSRDLQRVRGELASDTVNASDVAATLRNIGAVTASLKELLSPHIDLDQHPDAE